jgi:predicted CXXCH cytochrome family protein
VADNACENCHRPHTAGTPERLLTFADEEENCLACHNGNVAATNIEREFAKFSTHPVYATEGVHDPGEDLLDSPRHVECVDCHNPHAANTAAGGAARPAGALAGVAGVTDAGSPIRPVDAEHELCFRCHGDSANRGSPWVDRQYQETNTRIEFSVGNDSYHPVVGPGKNPDAPSLLSPYTASGQISCSACHNNDAGPEAGGIGPAGPHGSTYPPILERNLVLHAGSEEELETYALCYKCHSRSSILGNESFPLHRQHVVEHKAACTTCHDPHGVPDVTHLINFDSRSVKPNSKGRLEFRDQGPAAGSCSLSCHGSDHDEAAYPQVLQILEILK